MASNCRLKLQVARIFYHDHVPLTGPVGPTGARIEEGPLFRRFSRAGSLGTRALSSRAVANLIKELAAAIGEDPADYSGHSLRAGYATSAARQGHDALRIAQQTRHSRLDSVQGYVREANAFADHPLFDLLRVPDKV